jgi:heme oxygenase
MAGKEGRMGSESSSIMERLRTETSELHSGAESRKLQKEIAGGLVERGKFVSYLGQLYQIHSALEGALRATRESNSAVATMATLDRMRVPDLERDLNFYGVDVGSVESGRETLKFTDRIEAARIENPSALLGALYVLEGSTNGGKFLARVLQKTWGLDGGGLSYLDPYGNDQRERWTRFKYEMDTIDFDAADREAIVEMAKRTFEAIAAVSDEVAGVA